MAADNRLRKPVWLIGFAAGAVLAALISPSALSAPVEAERAAQRIAIRAKRLKGTAKFVQTKLKIRPVKDAITWQYIPETSVSVPFMKVEILGIPKTTPPLTVLVEKAGNLKPDKEGRYFLSLPMLETENRVKLTLINLRGQLEEWALHISLGLQETAIFVDETCQEYRLKVRELKRPGDPNLLFIGCRPGNRPHHLSLDLFWKGADRVKFRSQVLRVADSIVTLPMEHGHETTSKLLGEVGSGNISTYEIYYNPVVPKPYEIWAGIAFFQTLFSQTNFDSEFSQISSAFLGKVWYRPEDIRLSLMVRGFGSLLSFSDELEPDQGYEESVQTYFVSTELRYKVLSRPTWSLSPFLGGWFYTMRVESRNFGLQRIITPIIGVSGEYHFGRRDRTELTLRIVPLQSFINPFEFSHKQSYFETEVTYVHELLRGGRIFGTFYAGVLRYAPEGLAETRGAYFVLGGGYGF